jgi:hypothetical protein
MRKYFNSLRSNPLQIARAILAVTLLLALLSSSFPAPVFASGQMCELACCAGRPAHAAGSCMNGSCHTGLLAGSKTVHFHVRIANQESDSLCGLSRVTAAGTLKFLQVQVTEARSFDNSSDASADSSGSRTSQTEKATVSLTVLTKPCQPDCGSCGSGFVNSNRQRDAAARARADRPRPPSGVGLDYVDYLLSRKFNGLCRRGTPRGPPNFPS